MVPAFRTVDRTARSWPVPGRVQDAGCLDGLCTGLIEREHYRSGATAAISAQAVAYQRPGSRSPAWSLACYLRHLQGSPSQGPPKQSWLTSARVAGDDGLAQDGLELRRVGAARVAQVDLVVLASPDQPAGVDVLVQGAQLGCLIVVWADVQELQARPLMQGEQADVVDGWQPLFRQCVRPGLLDQVVRYPVRLADQHRPAPGTLRSGGERFWLVRPPQALQRRDDEVAAEFTFGRELDRVRDRVHGLDRGGVFGRRVRGAVAVDREKPLLRYVGHASAGVLKGIELFELALDVVR